MDSPDQASNDQPVLEGALCEVGGPLEEGIPVGGPSNVDEIGEVAPSRIAAAPMLPSSPSDTESSRKGPPDRVLLSLYVSLQERIHLPRAWLPLIQRVIRRSFIAGAPSTKRSLRLCICATSILIISKYQWGLAQSNIPSRSSSIWIRRLSSWWPRTRCLSVTLIFTDRLS